MKTYIVTMPTPNIALVYSIKLEGLSGRLCNWFAGIAFGMAAADIGVKFVVSNYNGRTGEIQVQCNNESFMNGIRASVACSFGKAVTITS